MKRVMGYGKRLHPDDSTSTYLFIKKLEKESFNSVVVYNPQGETTVIGPKSYGDMDEKNNFFVIGIQTKQQLDIFEQNSSKVVCIGSAYRPNQYALSSITILVPDEFNKGYPVGHLLSSREDESTIKPFLEEIKRDAAKA